MTALELLGAIQPNLKKMVAELPDGTAKTVAKVAASAAPAILAGAKDTKSAGDTHAWLEIAASVLIQQLPKVLPQTGAAGVATAAVIAFIPDILKLLTVEKVHVVYELSAEEHPPEIV